jgi:hypothetical protein
MKQIPSWEGDGGSAGEDIPAFCRTWTFTEALTWSHWGQMLHSRNMPDFKDHKKLTKYSVLYTFSFNGAFSSSSQSFDSIRHWNRREITYPPNRTTFHWTVAPEALHPAHVALWLIGIKK